jgi:peptidoglycan/LPS O-acetylase OafA/YrhL
MLAASLCVLRYDVLSAFRSTPASQETHAASDTVGARPAILIGSGLCLLMLAAFVIFDAQFTIDFSGGGFIALVVAFCCAQLSLAPLVLGPLFGSKAEGVGGVSPGWALAILCISAAAGLAVVAIYFATGNEPWLWAAIPACIGSGWLLFAIARLRPPEAASK